MRIAYETMLAEFERVLTKYGFSPKRAHEAAEIFAQNSLAGVFSHGLNRFPRVVEYLRKGEIDPVSEAECIASFGAMERWDGKRGFGPLNAKHAMDRAIELAHQFGIGMVALGNNNHWMRGGTYGWQAADAGCIGICWSNTCPNMPAWGAKDNHIGNNPLILAVPRSNGEHIMVDCALSQFSYGKLETMRLAGKQLPFPGGFDKDGNLTSDPGAIEASGRILPTGYWKGSGMAIALDLAAAAMANGKTGADLDREGQGSCTGCCQIFIAYDPYLFGEEEEIQAKFDDRVAAADATTPEKEGGHVTCPGERTAATRARNLAEGIVVDEQVWQQCLDLAAGKMDTKDIASTCILDNMKEDEKK